MLDSCSLSDYINPETVLQVATSRSFNGIINSTVGRAILENLRIKLEKTKEKEKTDCST